MHRLPRAAALLAWPTLALLASCALPGSRPPGPLFSGYLCCNMQRDGAWISDINYRAARAQIVPAGTPVKVTGYGRWRVLLEIEGRPIALGNDFSRTIKLDEFAKRYVLESDPRRKLAAYPASLRDAIREAKVAREMTREQVVMALGYPVTTYTAELDAPLWRYWLTSSDEFQVFWDEAGKVDRVFGAPATRAKVAVE